ncbi:hypothetical protein B0H13DRAFT_2059233 [Mycena leptocephala]|nr:hypothetical protein B0H13DRAFT_2059233 [Mycena leptocephala]
MTSSFLLCVAGRALSQSPAVCRIATGTQTSMMGTARSLCARKGLNENIWGYIRHMLVPYLVWASCADGHGERAGWLFVSCL